MKLNLSRNPLDVTFKPTISHFHDLKYASKKMAELEQQIQEQEWRNHQMLKYGSYSVIVYVVLAIVLVYVFYKLYKSIRHYSKGRRCLRAITGSPSSDIPSAECGGAGTTVNINIQTSNESLATASEAIPLRCPKSSPSPSLSTRSLRPRTVKSYF